MPRFTSWEINVFLCLVSLGLPEDLVREWIKNFKKIHEGFVLEQARDYHCYREKIVDMGKIEMLYFSRGDLYDPFWHFPKAISRLESIPVMFHRDYCNLQNEFDKENRRS